MAIRYLSGINVDSNTLFVDDANNRVGIGTASPDYALDLGTSGTGNQIRARRIYANGTGTDSGFTLDSILIFQGASNSFNITNPGSYPSVAFTINSSGNVGIGNTSPSRKLQVEGSIAQSGSTWNGNTRIHTYPDNYHSWYYHSSLLGGQGSADVMTYYQNFVIRHEDSTNVLVINGSGSVGIGTAAPASKLHVYNGEAIIATSTDGLKLSYSVGNSSGIIDTAFSDNNLEFRTNGTAKMWIANGGNVGIGTTSPGYKLDVAGDFRSTGNIRSNNGTVDNILSWTSEPAGVVGTLSNHPEAFWTNGSEKMRITASGKVGIGTTNPTQRLSVAGNTDLGNSVGSTLSSTHTTKISGYAMRYDASNRYGNYGVLILNSDSGWTASARKFMLTSGLNTNKFAIIRSVDADTDPSFGDGGAISSGTADFVITNSGNIGIGTTNPNEKLDVAGAVRMDTGVTEGVHYAGTGFQHWGDVGTGVDFPANDTIDILTSSTSRVRIDSTGNVGIGTTSPGKTLDIVGEIRTSGRATFNEYVNTGFVYGNTDLVLAYSGGTTGIIINSSGNVGIGTTSPNFKLDVNGDVRIESEHYLRFGGVGSGDEKWVIHKTSGGDLNFGEYAAADGRLYLKSGGNVGIGTTSPSYNLDVQGSTNGIIRAYGGSIGRLSLQNSTRHYSLSVQGSSFYLYDEVGAATRMLIDSSGNVGIGTASPSSVFHVSSNSTVLTLEDANSSYPTATSFISFRDNGTQGTMGTIGYASDGNLKLTQNNPTKYIVLDGANVGVGTTSPTSKTHVYYGGGTTNGLHVQASANRGKIAVSDNDTAAYMIAENSLASFGRQDALSANNLNITSGGNVLIGTTTDNGKKLQVQGDVFIKGSASTSGTTIFEVQNSNGTSIMDFRGDAYAFFGCGQGGGAASGFIFRYNDTSHVQFTGYNYGNGAGSYKPILLDTDLVGRGQGIYVNFGGTGYANPAPLSSTEFAVRGRTSDASQKVMQLHDSNNNEIFSVQNDGAVFTQGSQGWSGTVNFPTNAPGQQNLQFVNGILTNVF